MIITIEYPAPPPPDAPTLPPGVMRVKRWGDALVRDLTNWDTRNVAEAGNFMHMGLASALDGIARLESVSQFQKLDAAARAYLVGLQRADEYSVKSKTDWLGLSYEGKGFRPYWLQDGALRFGTCVFGGQYILLEFNEQLIEYEFTVKWPTRTTREKAIFYRVIPLPKSMWGKANHKEHPYWIQKCTIAYATPQHNTYSDTPKGNIFHPVWDYPGNYAGPLYIPKAFVE